jgi:hypothetical protein
MSRTIEVPEYEVHDEVRVDPARTALVVVDMQNDFVRHGGSLRGPDAEATIPAILGLLELARAKGMPVGLGDTRPASSRPTPRSEPACPRPRGGRDQITEGKQVPPARPLAAVRRPFRRSVLSCGAPGPTIQHGRGESAGGRRRGVAPPGHPFPR